MVTIYDRPNQIFIEEAITICNTATTDLWYEWNDTLTTSTTTSSTIYSTWLNTATGTGIVYPLEETTEQRISRMQQLEAVRQEQQRQYQQQKKERIEALNKSTLILTETLNQHQRQDFEKHGYFFVQSPSGRLYRIREGRAINIDLMKGQSKIVVEKRLCAHPAINCPNRDTMLIQKVMLEHQEAEFLRIANEYDPIRH